MKRTRTRTMTLLIVTLSAATLLLTFLFLLRWPHSAVAGLPPVESRALAIAVMEIFPKTAANDLDTSVIITGTDFTAVPTVTLGVVVLDDVTWISSTRLAATVPWGLDPGVYTLTVQNPGALSANLPNAFTVTQGIGVWNPGELYGGSVDGMIINPLTPTTLYVSSEQVGVFRSQDAAGTWSLEAAGGYVRGLTLSPAAPETLFVSLTGPRYVGLHRSDDGGDTWAPLDLPGDYAYPHPTDPDVVYASLAGDSGGGLWRSEDRGQSWTSITSGLTDTEVWELVFDPTDPLTIYVGTNSGSIFVSSDGGDNWSFVAQPTDMIQTLAINPRGDHELWVSNCCFCSTLETLRSTNADHTAWTPVAGPVGSNSMRTIAFPPGGWGGDVYSTTAYASSCWGQSHHTADGGASWSEFGPREAGGSFALHPTNPNVIYWSGARDGVFKTTDGGTNWQIANEGLAAVIPDQLVATPDRPDTLFALATRSNGFYKGTRGGATWQSVAIPGIGSPETLAVDLVTPTRVYAGVGGNEYVTLHVSEDGGETWPISVPITITDAYTECANMINVIAADPSLPGDLLLDVEHLCMGMPGVHAGAIYRSTDAGLSWELAAISGTDAISPVTAIVHDALTPTIVYASTGLWGSGSGLLRSTDGGANWERIATGIPALDFVTDLAVEQSAPYRVFAWTDIPTGLYVSEDHGESWVQADEPLSGFQVEEILCTEEDPSWLYAAVSQAWNGPGLYRSSDGARSWERAGGALGQVPVYSLDTVTATDRVFLYAGTTGGAIPVANRSLASRTAEELVNAGVYRHTSVASTGEPFVQRNWRLVNENGFGDTGNMRVSTLDVFDERLYAGTWSRTGSAEVWRSGDGTTWSDVTPAWVSTTKVLDGQLFDGALYVGTDGDAGAIWRTDGLSWSAVVSGGFGDTTNEGMGALVVFSDTLYALAENSTSGMEVWRSTTGDVGTWVQVNADGFGAGATQPGIATAVYSDALYVGIRRNDVAELWRSADGVTWTAVFTDGLGEPNNSQVTSLVPFEGMLYVGLRNGVTGGQIWHSTDGSSWTRDVTAGLGDADNVVANGLYVFSDRLFLVFANWFFGAEVWTKKADGTEWKRSTSNGWGDANNSQGANQGHAVATFKSALYVGTFNYDDGGEVWRYGFDLYLPLTLKE